MDGMTEKDVFERHLIEKCDFLRKEKNLKKKIFSKKIFFSSKFLSKNRKRWTQLTKNMIPTSKFRFPSSMTSQITEKRKIAIFRKSDLYFGGHMTS